MSRATAQISQCGHQSTKQFHHRTASASSLTQTDGGDIVRRIERRYAHFCWVSALTHRPVILSRSHR
jgi:hypothetical protein